jgi:hypothetical protein
MSRNPPGNNLEIAELTTGNNTGEISLQLAVKNIPHLLRKHIRETPEIS